MKETFFIKEFTAEEKYLLQNELVSIYYPNENYDSYIQKIANVLERNRPLFSDLIQIKNLSQQPPHFYGGVKIKNLPIDLVLPMPPKNGGGYKRIEKSTYISENILTLFGLIFGEPYSMHCEGRGLINNLIPKEDAIGDLTGLGSDTELGFHIENVALRYFPKKDCSPKALLFIGVRQQTEPPYTPMSDARKALDLLNHDDIVQLASPAYRIKLPYRWRKVKKAYASLLTDYIPIIQWESAYLINNGAFYGDMLIDVKTLEARRAANKFIAALEQVKYMPVVSPGELICIDNRVMYHSRKPFKAVFDEQGRAHRWLQRLFVAEHLDKFSDWKHEDDRIYSPMF